MGELSEARARILHRYMKAYHQREHAVEGDDAAHPPSIRRSLLLGFLAISFCGRSMGILGGGISFSEHVALHLGKSETLPRARLATEIGSTLRKRPLDDLRCMLRCNRTEMMAMMLDGSASRIEERAEW